MQNITNTKKLSLACLALALTFNIGCATQKVEPPPPQVATRACPTCPLPVPGAVEYVWEPPLVDVIEVPPGIDPEGIYYRPAHQEVVEIRQGRWQHYKQAE